MLLRLWNKYASEDKPLRNILIFLVAVLLAATAGSIVQSLYNLSAIAALTGPITFSAQSQMIFFDIQHFMPVLAAIFTPILILSLVTVHFIHRSLALALLPATFAVTALATWLALLLINFLAPMPTLIALNRSTSGTLLLLCCIASAAVFFQYANSKRRQV